MNRITFAVRNVWDKARKALRRPGTLGFYVRTYLGGRASVPAPDVYVVSYPKCGRTWLRAILCDYLSRIGVEQSPRDAFRLRLPEGRVLMFDHDGGNWVPAPRRADRLRFDAERYAGRRVVFLVRDPRDVLVSSWYHLRYRERIYRGTLDAFAMEPLVGIGKVLAFMRLWLEQRGVPAAFLLLRYEDLHADAAGAAARVLEFAGCRVDRAHLEAAVDAARFEKMKRREAAAGDAEEPWRRPGVAGNEASMKVRRGQVGGYREEFSPQGLARVEAVMCEQMPPELDYGERGTDAGKNRD